ncbi:uncharacterized protein LOC112156499 [Oryzias melastigma]|uniref:uncharacterized protein LOC112156499 n=1 Tax=Oryzias melastigma TaxID=30732 RepID=UPI000CF82463|nr:uncharacterized protein LOC112156499 [Oryzias melastigma]
MTDGAAEVVVEDSGPAQSPLVSITFQRDVNWKKKYLEAEPKALGITQIGLSLYVVVCLTVFHSQDLPVQRTMIAFYCFSLMVVIAGSVALSAQNLHLSTLKACLVMEIVASLASFCNIMMSLIENSWVDHKCWIFYEDKNSTSLLEVCLDLERVSTRFFAGSLLIHSALLAISITLVVYCCKVVKCCGPPPKVPMITVQTPPRHHDQETAQRSTHE